MYNYSIIKIKNISFTTMIRDTILIMFINILKFLKCFSGQQFFNYKTYLEYIFIVNKILKRI